MDLPAVIGARQKVNNVPLPLEGEYRSVSCISKSNAAIVAESHGCPKQLRWVLGTNSSYVILFSLTVPGTEVGGSVWCVQQIRN